MRAVVRRGASALWPSAVDGPRRWQETAEAAARVEQEVAALRADVARLAQQVAEQPQPQPTHDDRLDRLRHLVAKVEPYQPLYGVTGIIDNPARPSADRAAVVAAALGNLRGQRVLDIGSSLGYMSFHLAAHGALVTGWEANADNAEVARLVGEINGLDVTFRTEQLDLGTLGTLHDGDFDAVLVLSVLHHVVHFQGLDAAQKIVAGLLDVAPVLVLELASKGEDPGLFWDAAQPEDPLAVLDLVRDDVEVTRIGTSGTHLSSMERPLYRVARRKVVEVSGHRYPYDDVTYEAYAGSPVATGPWRRRYLHHQDHVVKEYAFSPQTPDNWSQIVGELYVHSVLGTRAPLHHGLRLLAAELGTERARIVLARTPGRLLSDVAPLPVADLARVAGDVLTTLRDLEAAGLHHNDVRSWNILVAQDGGGWLLDYGRASHDAYEDDVVALAHALAAGARGGREGPQERKSELPDLTVFDGTPLADLADALRAGERDAGTLARLVPSSAR